ncbi:MAG TPA: cupin domain-containing protein [Vicinamibacteria bacterium]|nr:cupin domain-containing protein [Vicinamibacteria bacterium]
MGAVGLLRKPAWTLWLLGVVLLTVRWATHAQTEQRPADDPRFTGVSTALEPEGLTISRRRFEAGARSAWHFHDHGQLLFVEEGRARTQKRGERMREMGPGDSDYTQPKVQHWHGAAPHEHFIQVAVGFGSGITWLEKTTDEQYDGKAR